MIRQAIAYGAGLGLITGGVIVTIAGPVLLGLGECVVGGVLCVWAYRSIG